MQPTQRKLSSQHLKSLDGVRGVAILLVLFCHLSVSCLPSSTVFLHIVHEVLYFGWSGVQLFFVLSGFLITGILLDTKEASNYFQAFYARRVLRIFPLYYAVLISLFCLSNTHIGNGLNSVLPLPSARPLYFAYLSNWQSTDPNTGPNLLGPFWSLAVEEQFYFVWPLVVWLLPRKILLPLCLAGTGTALLLRVVLFASHVDLWRIMYGTFTVGLDSLLAGAAIAVIVRDRALVLRARRWIYIAGLTGFLALLGTAASAGNLMPHGWRCCWFYTCLSAIFAMFVFHVFVTAKTDTQVQRALRSNFLVSFGKYSYGIYVYHWPILALTDIKFGAQFGLRGKLLNSIAIAAAVFVASYFTAKLSYHCFEIKFLNMKRFFEPKPKSADSALLAAEKHLTSTTAVN